MRLAACRPASRANDAAIVVMGETPVNVYLKTMQSRGCRRRGLERRERKPNTQDSRDVDEALNSGFYDWLLGGRLIHVRPKSCPELRTCDLEPSALAKNVSMAPAQATQDARDRRKVRIFLYQL